MLTLRLDNNCAGARRRLMAPCIFLSRPTRPRLSSFGFTRSAHADMPAAHIHHRLPWQQPLAPQPRHLRCGHALRRYLQGKPEADPQSQPDLSRPDFCRSDAVTRSGWTGRTTLVPRPARSGGGMKARATPEPDCGDLRSISHPCRRRPPANALVSCRLKATRGHLLPSA